MITSFEGTSEIVRFTFVFLLHFVNTICWHVWFVFVMRAKRRRVLRTPPCAMRKVPQVCILPYMQSRQLLREPFLFPDILHVGAKCYNFREISNFDLAGGLISYDS